MTGNDRSQSISLLTTKLHPPRLRPDAIERPTLLDKLNLGLTQRLTLISARAGFGKTTLLAEWLARSRQPTVWLSLDENDDDPTRFLLYLIAGLQTQQPGLGQQAQELRVSPLENLLTALVNELARVPAGLVIISTDYHLLYDQVIHQALNFLLTYRPPQIRFAISSCSDEP